MAYKRDYYEILGLHRDAGEKELKSAYRKLVKLYHPDTNPDDAGAEEKIKEINEAYAVLSDASKRADYDQYGHAAPERGGARKGSGPFSGGFGGSADINFDDLFTKGFGNYYSGGRKSEPGRGRDISANIRISWDEAVYGAEKELTINYPEKCGYCNGMGSISGKEAGNCAKCNGTGQERVITQSAFGKMTQTRECAACRGTGKDMKGYCTKCSGRGYIKTSKKTVVKIPKGVVNGQTVTISGMGEPGEREGLRGDLVVKVSVRPKYGF